MADVPPTHDGAEGSAPAPPAIACPWCLYTAAIRKHVLTHMEAAHPQRWRDLALAPPIAGGVH
jgi:hypothetical protein